MFRTQQNLVISCMGWIVPWSRRLELTSNPLAAAKLYLEFTAELLEEAESKLAEGNVENTEIALYVYLSEIYSLAQLVANSEGDLPKNNYLRVFQTFIMVIYISENTDRLTSF